LKSLKLPQRTQKSALRQFLFIVRLDSALRRPYREPCCIRMPHQKEALPARGLSPD